MRVTPLAFLPSLDSTYPLIVLPPPLPMSNTFTFSMGMKKSRIPESMKLLVNTFNHLAIRREMGR
jgi:hypothetical protein